MSHDRLLTAGGYAGPHAERPPLGLADVLPPDDVARCREGDQPAARYSLPPGAESARLAREFTRFTLQGWGIPEAACVTELVVSELVTNSLRHGLLSGRWMPGEHPIGLTILRRVPYLMCMVTDPASAPPRRVDACAGAESGRGLQVVESCSLNWGWQPVAGDGKVVWAVLGLTELPAPAPAPALAAFCVPPRCPGRLRTSGRRTLRPWPRG